MLLDNWERTRPRVNIVATRTPEPNQAREDACGPNSL
jgi:hypothetical protein